MVKHYDPKSVKVFFDGKELKAPGLEAWPKKEKPYKGVSFKVDFEPYRLDPETGDLTVMSNGEVPPVSTTLAELRSIYDKVTQAITPKHNIPITGTSGLSLALGFEVKSIDLLTKESPYGPPRRFLCIGFTSRDRETGAPIELTFSALLPPNIAEIELHTYIRREILKLCEHEIDEGLRMHGKQIRDPHAGEYRPERIPYSLCYFCLGSRRSSAGTFDCPVCFGTGRI